MSNQIFNFVPRVLSYPPPGAREGRVGENPGNEVAKYFFGSGYCPHPLLGRILRVLWHVKSIPRGYQAILSITSSGHASVTRKFTRSYVSGLGAWFLARKTVSSHQISILPRNQGLFISVARKLVKFEVNRVISTALMGHVNKCLYLSRSCYHTAVSRSWPHHLRTEFQRFFQVSRRLEHLRCPFVSYFLFSSLVDSF